MTHKESSEEFARLLLIGLRRLSEQGGLNFSNLPRWLRAADIRIAEVSGSTIILFEQSAGGSDQVVEYCSVENDIEFVFPGRTSGEEFNLLGLGVDETEDLGVNSVSTLTLAISTENQTFTDIHQHRRHQSTIFFDVFLEYQPEQETEAVRYLPFALFLTPGYLEEFSSFWSNHSQFLSNVLSSAYRSPYTEYRTEAVSEKGILSSIDDTVIILGSYDEPHESELRQIKDYLIRLGYDAFLIKDLPGRAEMSLDEKVKLWTTASRYCIMVDREASGHIKEYEIVKSERKPLILLRPNQGGSTWMIGDDELTDFNFIKTFKFDRSPLGAVEEGVQWAEDFLTTRGETYPEFYPWKES